MDGKEIETKQHDDGSWEAKDGELTGIGPSEDAAQRDLLRIKTTSPDSPRVSELTLSNKAKVTDSFETSQLIITKLKRPTNPAKSYVAYYSDEPEVQGYGDNEINAKLDLFSQKKKNA